MFGIDENAPDKYEQLYCRILACDDELYTKIVPLKIISQDKYVEDRLMNTVPSVTSQFIEMYYQDKGVFNSNFYFNNFKTCLKEFGANSVSIEDWAYIATIAFAKHIRNRKYKYSVEASFIGYIDLPDQKNFSEYDDLCTIKEKYKEKMKDVIRDSTYYRNIENDSKSGDLRVARNFFDKEMEKLQMEKSEINEEIEREE